MIYTRRRMVERISILPHDTCASKIMHTFVSLIVVDDVHEADQLWRNTTVQGSLPARRGSLVPYNEAEEHHR
ncbi:hypothetical protein IG631_12630 [Alternaria alternata]|nr:hypothetical protein IG631_12630 [Alternaria alternata]